MPAALVAGAGMGLAGSLISANQASSAQQQAQNLTQQAVAAIQAVGGGPDLAQQLLLQQYKQAGTLTPQLEQQINATFQQIAPVSSQVSGAQQGALSQLAQLSQTGLNASDRLALSQIQANSAKQQQASTNDIIQNLASRGQLDSGAEIAARLSAGQNAQNSGSQQSLQVAANANQNALSALAQQGNLSTQMAGQQFSQNQAQANIQNEQQRFNVQNQLGIQAANTANVNQAQAANLANAQSIANANTSQANQEQLRQLNAQQQMYQNAMGAAQAQAGALTGQGQQIAQYGQNNAGATAGMFGGLASGTNALGAYAAGQQSAANNNLNSGSTGSNSYGPIQQGQTSAGSSWWQGGQIPYSQGGQVREAGPVLASDNSLYDFACGGMVGYDDGGIVNKDEAIKFGQALGSYDQPKPSPSPSPAPAPKLNEYMTGGKVAGRAPFYHNNPKNDVVDAKLSPGELVIPRDDMHDLESALAFVRKTFHNKE